MIEYQHWGIHADGTLAFAGVKRRKHVSLAGARSHLRQWLAWAQKYVAENPGEYPLAESMRRYPVNPVVEIRYHPVGHPEQVQSFLVGPKETVES